MHLVPLTDELGLDASLESWRSPAYQHYNMSIIRNHSNNIQILSSFSNAVT